MRCSCRAARNGVGATLQRLELVLEQIAAVEAERDAVVETQPEADPDAAKVVLLTKLRAIGPEMATVLMREALFRSFASRKELAAYAGLTPSPYASGSVQRDQGVAKAGNPRLRTAMIELAWLWLRYQPGSALGQEAGGDVAPQSDQQLAGHGDDGDPADSTL